MPMRKLVSPHTQDPEVVSPVARRTSFLNSRSWHPVGAALKGGVLCHRPLRIGGPSIVLCPPEPGT